MTSLKDCWDFSSKRNNLPLDNKILQGLPHPVIWTSRNRFCCGRPTTDKPSTCSSSPSSRKDPRLPRPRLLLGVPSLRFSGTGGPEAPRGSQPGSAPALPSRGGTRLQVPNTPSRVSFLRLFEPGGGPEGLVWYPQACGGRSLSHRSARSLLGLPSWGHLRPAASGLGVAGFPRVSSATPLPGPSLRGPGPCPQLAPAELRWSTPPMEKPELLTLRGSSRGRGRGRPRGSTLSTGPQPSGAPASSVCSGARAELAREEGVSPGDPLLAPVL